MSETTGSDHVIVPTDDMPAPDESVRIRVHPGLCVGWGNCHRWAPDVYPLDELGQVAFHVLEVSSEHAEAARWGALACPAHAISYQGAGGAR